MSVVILSSSQTDEAILPTARASIPANPEPAQTNHGLAPTDHAPASTSLEAVSTGQGTT
jgi:hypothetical protein